MTSPAPGERVDVAVAGAGFAGLALAISCADAGLRVVVLERRPELSPEGVGLQLQPNGLDALDALGLGASALAAGYRFAEVQRCDASGHVRQRLRYDELDHPHPYLLGIERPVLVRLLADRLLANAELRVGCAVSGVVHRDGRAVGLRYTRADGSERVLEADCVVGADGAGSSVRTAMGGRVRFCTGPDPYVIGLVARQPTSEAVRLYEGRGWCDGVLPYGERTYFFDHIGPENRDAVQQRDFAAWADMYAARVPEGSDIVAGLRGFDDVALLRGRTHVAWSRTAPGVALIGDAAAAVHPHTGQGANTALTDAHALAEELVRHGPAAPAALAAYERRRTWRMRAFVPWSVAVGRTMDAPSPLWSLLRRGSHGAMRLGPLRRQAIRAQAGLV